MEQYSENPKKILTIIKKVVIFDFEGTLTITKNPMSVEIEDENEVPAEFKQELIHKKGALAAARMGDNVNPQKASSGSQFYIAQGKRYTSEELNMLQARMGKQFNQIQKDTYVNEGGVPFLDYEYTVFGQVIEGLEVIDKIAKVQKDRYDRPVEDVKMTISIVE